MATHGIAAESVAYQVRVTYPSSGCACRCSGIATSARASEKRSCKRARHPMLPRLMSHLARQQLSCRSRTPGVCQLLFAARFESHASHIQKCTCRLPNNRACSRTVTFQFNTEAQPSTKTICMLAPWERGQQRSDAEAWPGASCSTVRGVVEALSQRVAACRSHTEPVSDARAWRTRSVLSMRGALFFGRACCPDDCSTPKPHSEYMRVPHAQACMPLRVHLQRVYHTLPYEAVLSRNDACGGWRTRRLHRC